MKNRISALALSMFMTVNLVFALPYGTPVDGKQGYVTSPYAEYEGYVDVRNFPAGTEVKCPYSGKIFLVPSQVAAEGSNSEVDPVELEKIKAMLQELKEQIQAASSQSNNDESCNEEAMSNLEASQSSSYETNHEASDDEIYSAAYNQAFAEARANGDSLLDSRKYAKIVAKEKVNEKYIRRWNSWGKDIDIDAIGKQLEQRRSLGNFPSFDGISTQ